MVKMLDMDRHSHCPLWESLDSNEVPWTGMRFACLNVLHAYCKVFEKREIYDLIVRKTCQSCKCPREAHAIYQQQATNVHERLGFKVVSPTESGVEPRDLGYTWVPPGIRVSSRINRYFEQIPVEKVPKIGSAGARYREQQIAYQLPKQDLSLEYCKHLEELHEASYEDFVTARNEIALDIGYIKDAPYDEHCAHCSSEINVGEMVVAAPKFVESVMWHPSCFTCNTCYELLVDLTYCVHEDKIYCERHYAELLKPRCAGCDELQDSMRQQLVNAKSKEARAGTQVMKDGVPYKDGFRIETQQALIDQLKEQLKNKELGDLRRQELEKELAKQTKIAEQLRKRLDEVETVYKMEEDARAQELLKEKKQSEYDEGSKKEEHNGKEADHLGNERIQRSMEHEEEEAEKMQKVADEDEEAKCKQQQHKEAEYQTPKLVEVEELTDTEQRQREEAKNSPKRSREAEIQEEVEENERRLLNLERENEIQEEVEENERRLLNLERENEQKQAAKEATAELAATHLLSTEEKELTEANKEVEFTEKERQFEDSIKELNLNEEEGRKHQEAELLTKILKAREQLGEESEEEQSLRLIHRERDSEFKQKRIDENALIFMEAEKEMAELQSKILDAVEKRVLTGSLDSAPHTPVVEEPCVKRNFSPLLGYESSHSTVKTQLAQDIDKPSTVKTKPLRFLGVSDDASSIDPASSQQSSFSTQPSEEITTGTDSQYPPQERQEPDGEDTNLANMQYSDDYLRSLDGIKKRTLTREDGSGRRRAFKKRRSSNSSNSSRESRQSRDEELKMFTSLEEEEMNNTEDSEFAPIRYTTEPTLKVKGHHRRHKRSPAKDMRWSDDSLRSSLERLGEEKGDPWGEVKPEHYKHTEFWKREKTLSIDEEAEVDKPAPSEEGAYDTANNLPTASSFEEASQQQNQEALTVLQKHSSGTNIQKGISDDQDVFNKTGSVRSDNTNLPTCNSVTKEKSPARSSASPRLRRSPRIEEMNQYEERWKEKSDLSTAQNTPAISIQTPLDCGPWRDEYGLIMEGLSDFYDFTASVNPSRSRSASKNVSPVNTAPNTPLPKNVSFQLNLSKGKATIDDVDIYDDTECLGSNKFLKRDILQYEDFLNGCENNTKEENKNNTALGVEFGITNHLQYVADDLSKTLSNKSNLVPLVNITDDAAVNTFQDSDSIVTSDAAMNALVSSLRAGQTNTSRSRSKSPLPTHDNLKRSVENRRYKMIKHNEDILEKLIESKLLPELTTNEEIEIERKTSSENQTCEFDAATDKEESSQEHTSSLIQSLHVDSRRSRSKSPMHLPTPENLNKGLEKRRNKLIERNDEFIKQLEERSLTPQSPTIVVEEIYEIEPSEETPTMFFDHYKNEEPLSPEENCSREEMCLLVQSLRVARSKTRSKSPMRIQETENFNETLKLKSYYGIKDTEYVEAAQCVVKSNVPTISVDISEVETKTRTTQVAKEEEDCSREDMNLLIQSLRVARSRSTSKSPMRVFHPELMQDIEPFPLSEIELEGKRSRHSRSMSPSPSRSPEAVAAYRVNTISRSLSPQPTCDDFYSMANSESSISMTLSTINKEKDSLSLSDRERQLDEEALEILRNASEERELKTSSSLIIEGDKKDEHQTQRAKLLKKSPTTPDYDRTISEEMRHIEGIKQDMLKKGFKRSTYVGESMDLGSEFEPLRKESAIFQRSRSPSPSFSKIEGSSEKKSADEKRKIQNLVLRELTNSSGKECKNTGAIPKAERVTSSETELSPTDEVEHTKYVNIRDDVFNTSFKHSTSAKHSESSSENFEELSYTNAAFSRPTSTTSTLYEPHIEELSNTEVETIFKKKLPDKVCCNSLKFKDFSNCLNTTAFDNDSAVIKVPDILVQNIDNVDIEPEEYHHDRKFSLAQEAPVEQYPGDDYICIQQIEVRTRSGSRTWLREDFFSEDVVKNQSQGINLERGYARNSTNEGNDNQNDDIVPGADDDEEYSNASEDDRQTVVEVDDEIDEDISDFNERGPAEESHNEISECEEAERDMDRYAGRDASDWNQAVENRLNETVNITEDEGAIGGLSNSPYDSDSFVIDQIYDDAIKNRKQSGILREYESIVTQISVNSDTDEHYLLWSKSNRKKGPKDIGFNTQILYNDRKDFETRYLGDANTTARQSARLRSRYGYSPVLSAKCLDDDFQVDLSYKPKREYNWRKNFKLDEDIVKEDKEITFDELYSQVGEGNTEVGKDRSEEEKEQSTLDLPKFSLLDETVNLFGHRSEMSEVNDDLNNETIVKENVRGENFEKSEKSKKKIKKKSHKESKATLVENINREDEDTYDKQLGSRRGNILQMDTDSPKRKSRSRRSSKSSLTTEETSGLFSPRSSVVYNETITGITEEFTDVTKETVRPKKIKKRKKVIETMANVAESPTENKSEFHYNSQHISEVPAVSAAVTPESSSSNILSILSPQNSVCVTPVSADFDTSIDELSGTIVHRSSTTDSSSSGNLSRTSSITNSSMDTFDILKDASFYPLF